jgi:hypothetical protein
MIVVGKLKRKMTNARVIYFVGWDITGRKIVWKESIEWKNRDIYKSLVDSYDLDIIRKAEEVGIEIPWGKNNAIEYHILIEKIITNLTYSI